MSKKVQCEYGGDCGECIYFKCPHYYPHEHSVECYSKEKHHGRCKEVLNESR